MKWFIHVLGGVLRALCLASLVQSALLITMIAAAPSPASAMGDDPEQWRERARRWRHRHRHRGNHQSVPELDPGLATTSGIVLLGGCLVIMSRRRKK